MQVTKSQFTVSGNRLGAWKSCAEKQYDKPSAEVILMTSLPTSTVSEDQHPDIVPVPLMELTTAFWAFKTLAAANEFDLFTRIAETGTTIEELSSALHLEGRPAEMLLTGCASLGLLEKRNGRYYNTSLAQKFLVRGGDYYFGGFVTMLDKRLYSGWDKLVDAIKTNRPTTWDPDKQESLFDNTDPSLMATFWQAMHSLSVFTARVLGQVVDFRRFKRLLDVGGGSGAFDIELCRLYPHLRATIYDLPFVTEIAARNAAEAGLSDRVGVVLRKCYEALPSKGSVIISELLVNDEKTGPPPAALMSLNMLIETRGGRNYTAAEYTAWLKDTGFNHVETVLFESAGANGAVIATKE